MHTTAGMGSGFTCMEKSLMARILSALAKDGLEVLQRRVMKSQWAQLSPYYLELDSEQAVRAAIPLLLYSAARIDPKKG